MVEARPGGIVVVSLANSTRATQKGLYHKTKHGFDLFGLIDSNMVMRNPPFTDKLVKLLLVKSDRFGPARRCQFFLTGFKSR